MKKYVIPAIKVKNVESEALMAALSKFDEMGDEGQFGKSTLFDEEANESLPKSPNVWDAE